MSLGAVARRVSLKQLQQDATAVLRQELRGIEQFQEKWEPVFRPELRQKGSWNCSSIP
jgi:hypothetical protein